MVLLPRYLYIFRSLVGHYFKKYFIQKYILKYICEVHVWPFEVKLPAQIRCIYASIPRTLCLANAKVPNTIMNYMELLDTWEGGGNISGIARSDIRRRYFQ